MGRFTEEDLKKSQREPRDEYGVKILNTSYDIDSICLLVTFKDPNMQPSHLSQQRLSYWHDYRTCMTDPKGSFVSVLKMLRAKN